METTQLTVPRGLFNVRLGGNPNGPAVVMLHGWPESSYCWEGVAAHLDPGLRIIAPDLRGLGDSERTTGVAAYQKVELAKDVIEVLDALEVEDFFLVGHDWGGVVAQEMALLVPERVKRLAIMNINILTNPKGTKEALDLIHSFGGIHFWYQHFQMMPVLPEAMIPGKEKVWISFFFGAAGQDGRIDPKAIAEYIRCYSIPGTPASAASYYRIMAKDNEHWDTLADEKFPMPGLFVYGNQDSVIIPQFLNHIEEGFDSIEVKQLDAAHFVQEEKPAEVATLLNEFFSRED